MPEYPEMQALAERLVDFAAGSPLAGISILSFSSLASAVPPYDDLIGCTVSGAHARGKYLMVDTTSSNGEPGVRLIVHLSQAGRLVFEPQAKTTKPRGALARFRFEDGRAVLFREFGTERKAKWWVVPAGEPGPTADLGPDVEDRGTRDFILTAEDGARLYTVLRDQHKIAGIGRGYTDDICHRAGLSPFATLSALDQSQRVALADAIEVTIRDALALERQRSGGLPDKLGDRFRVHRRAGEPCPHPDCDDTLERVSFSGYELVYCPTCQTDGKQLADRRLSRLLK
ncbi:MAG: Fpg/Nei family DNA glycosylase [Actinobacteria bacterium]|nr:Fpg/Nei family DNA glycosylase [Actinomycetota bacterium]MCB9388352.1 Fpg/Nei family DNA glycosylase [Acidimicrobiia bacterium]